MSILQIRSFINGPIDNNTYLVFDLDSRIAVVIDPSLACQPLLDFARSERLSIRQIWCTHAHFDHTIGTKSISASTSNTIQVALHAADLPLWKSGGGGSNFGYRNIDNPLPDILLADGQKLSLADSEWLVMHTPGHTPGGVTFYCAALMAAFCGDTIFYHSVGRTDMPGSSQADLIHSIRAKIFTLPPETTLYPGHGSSTTVAEELASNPFVNAEQKSRRGKILRDDAAYLANSTARVSRMTVTLI